MKSNRTMLLYKAGVSPMSGLCAVQLEMHFLPVLFFSIPLHKQNRSYGQMTFFYELSNICHLIIPFMDHVVLFPFSVRRISYMCMTWSKYEDEPGMAI